MCTNGDDNLKAKTANKIVHPNRGSGALTFRYVTCRDWVTIVVEGNCVPPTNLFASKSSEQYGLEILAANRDVDFLGRWVARNAALYQKSPRQAWPNRVRFRYGLEFLLGLLPTFPHGNAVTS